MYPADVDPCIATVCMRGDEWEQVMASGLTLEREPTSLSVTSGRLSAEVDFVVYIEAKGRVQQQDSTPYIQVYRGGVNPCIAAVQHARR